EGLRRTIESYTDLRADVYLKMKRPSEATVYLGNGMGIVLDSQRLAGIVLVLDSQRLNFMKKQLAGLMVNDPLLQTHKPLSVELGPGILGNIYLTVREILLQVETYMPSQKFEDSAEGEDVLTGNFKKLYDDLTAGEADSASTFPPSVDVGPKPVSTSERTLNDNQDTENTSAPVPL
ncbi:V-type proton ATPase catalytic subunit A, partial [Tanacetum coccineum]